MWDPGGDVRSSSSSTARRSNRIRRTSTISCWRSEANRMEWVQLLVAARHRARDDRGTYCDIVDFDFKTAREAVNCFDGTGAPRDARWFLSMRRLYN
jgi:hypothetical protein